MNILIKKSLKILHKIYDKTLNRGKSAYLRVTDVVYQTEETSRLISEMIYSRKPFMIARYGSTELMAIQNCISVNNGAQIWKYISGKVSPWWWEALTFRQMEQWSGFFPSNEYTIQKFTDLMLKDSKELDLLAEWKNVLPTLNGIIPDNCKVSHLSHVEPFFAVHPWTKALEGKKVLVVHPFNELIESQYHMNRNKLFKNQEMLPMFELKTIKAIQSLGGETNGFKDWFEALDWMKSKISNIDYDICLLGCGAYGFPLAAHCKRMGKQAIHLGGSLQLLWGILGNRWENPYYGVKEWGINERQYSNLINENWVRPGQKDRPKNANQVEGACYW